MEFSALLHSVEISGYCISFWKGGRKKPKILVYTPQHCPRHFFSIHLKRSRPSSSDLGGKCTNTFIELDPSLVLQRRTGKAHLSLDNCILWSHLLSIICFISSYFIS